MSDSNRVALRYAKETSFNQLPAANMTPLRMTGESLAPAVETIASAELRSDRMVADTVQVSRQNNGGFNFELSYGSFDGLFEGALCAGWSSNVLKNGTVKNSFSIEKAMLDVNQYFLFSGMMVNSMTLNLATGAIATGSFDFLGCSASLTQTSNAGTVAAGTTSVVMNCMTNVASLMESSYGGTLASLTGLYVQELSFTLANNLRPISGIGYNTIQSVGMGKMDITGSMNMHFADNRLYDKFLAATPMALQFQMTAGSKSYTILFPRIKLATSTIVSAGQDQDVMDAVTWQALRDPVTDCLMRITRSS